MSPVSLGSKFDGTGQSQTETEDHALQVFIRVIGTFAFTKTMNLNESLIYLIQLIIQHFNNPVFNYLKQTQGKQAVKIN